MIDEIFLNFGAQDLETALIGLGYPRKKEQTERVTALCDLIMGKFDQDRSAFREWSARIHQESIEFLPAIVESADSQAVKILNWDPGKYLKLTYRGIFQNISRLITFLKIRPVMHL